METFALDDAFGSVLAAPAVLLRLGAAVVFGMSLGLDRELRNKPAGLRTHMLVSLAAASFTVLILDLFGTIVGELPNANLDPLRVFEAVIAGVAFLGAGAIFRAGRDVRGMTTGASIWLAGAIGLGCGSGQLMIAATTTVLALLVLTAIGYLERYTGIKDHRGDRSS